MRPKHRQSRSIDAAEAPAPLHQRNLRRARATRVQRQRLGGRDAGDGHVQVPDASARHIAQAAVDAGGGNGAGHTARRGPGPGPSPRKGHLHCGRLLPEAGAVQNYGLPPVTRDRHGPRARGLRVGGSSAREAGQGRGRGLRQRAEAEGRVAGDAVRREADGVNSGGRGEWDRQAAAECRVCDGHGGASEPRGRWLEGKAVLGQDVGVQVTAADREDAAGAAAGRAIVAEALKDGLGRGHLWNGGRRGGGHHASAPHGTLLYLGCPVDGSPCSGNRSQSAAPTFLRGLTHMHCDETGRRADRVRRQET